LQRFRAIIIITLLYIIDRKLAFSNGYQQPIVAATNCAVTLIMEQGPGAATQWGPVGDTPMKILQYLILLASESYLI
jgi:hypothetical protein